MAPGDGGRAISSTWRSLFDFIWFFFFFYFFVKTGEAFRVEIEVTSCHSLGRSGRAETKAIGVGACRKDYTEPLKRDA